MKATLLLPILTALVGIVPSQAAIVWYAGPDLVANEIPNGPQELINPNPTVPEWSYGSRLTLASTTLNLFPATNHFGTPAEPFHGYNLNTTVVSVNTTASPAFWSSFGPFAPGEMFLHTGNANEFSIVRWTAPAAGIYQLAADWRLLDVTSTGITTSIVINGSTVFDQTVAPLGSSADNRSVTLSAGDTVDFAVGANGSNLSDVTAFNATITSAPEPSCAVLGALGGAVMLRRRRRQA